MSEFIIVAHPSDIQLQDGWHTAYAENTIVNNEDKIFSAAMNGRQYEIVAKHVRLYSLAERIGRACLALLATILTLGIALASSNLRRYFTESIKATKTFAVPCKIVNPVEPDPAGKIYPQDAAPYEEVAMTMDPGAIREAIQLISDDCINKNEIIKSMLLAILKQPIPDFDADSLAQAKEDIAARCGAVQVIIESGIDLNERQIGLYLQAKGSETVTSSGLILKAKGPGSTVIARAPITIASFLNELLDHILLRCDWYPHKIVKSYPGPGESCWVDVEPFPEPDVYLPVVNLCKPLINLLLAHGAKTYDEMQGSISTFNEGIDALVDSLRLEMKLVQHWLPAAVDEGASAHVLPKDILNLIALRYLDIPGGSGMPQFKIQ